MPEHVIKNIIDLPAGKCRVVHACGTEVVIFSHNGAYRAYKNECPHQGAPICGAFEARLEPQHIEPLRGRRPDIVRCPWHGWEFEIADGVSLIDPAIRLRQYPARECGDDLIITVEPD